MRFWSAFGLPLFLIMLVFIPAGFCQVNAGELAVVKVWGQARETKSEGLYFRFILSTEYHIYDLKTQSIKTEIEAYSQDAQSMTADLEVQFRLQADRAIDVANQFGDLRVLQERIYAISVERTKVVLSSESAMDLIKNRSTLSNRVENTIKDAIKQYYVDVSMVALTDITFSSAFEKTVEDKMIAEQEKMKAQFEAEKAVIEAQRDLDVARLAAEAAVEKAKGDGAAIVEVAKAQAEAMKVKTMELARFFGAVVESVDTDDDGTVIVFETLDASLLTDEQSEIIVEYLRYIAYLEAWDGKLPDVVGDVSLIIPKP